MKELLDIISGSIVLPLLAALGGGLFTLLTTILVQRGEGKRLTALTSHQTSLKRLEIKIDAFSKYIQTMRDFNSELAELGASHSLGKLSEDRSLRADRLANVSVSLRMNPAVLLFETGEAIRKFDEFNDAAIVLARIFQGDVEIEDLEIDEDSLVSDMLEIIVEELGEERFEEMSEKELRKYMKGAGHIETIRNIALTQALKISDKADSAMIDMIKIMRREISKDIGQ